MFETEFVGPCLVRKLKCVCVCVCVCVFVYVCVWHTLCLHSPPPSLATPLQGISWRFKRHIQTELFRKIGKWR